MDTINDNNKALFNSMMLNVITYLESLDDVRNIDFETNGNPCSDYQFTSWENKNMPYKLPNDLKALYRLMNGYSLKWKVAVGSAVTEVGNIALNNLENVVRIPVEGQIIHHHISCEYTGSISNNPYILSPSSNIPCKPDISTCAAFVIDSHPMFGQICLLYSTNSNNKIGSTFKFDSPEIWFQDCSCRWHYVASTLSQYLRLQTLHLGIFGWIFAYTPEGIPPVTYQWLNIYCKERLILDTYWLNRLYQPIPNQNTNLNANIENTKKVPSSTMKKAVK